MAAISSLSAVLTSRCRASVVFFVNWGDTIMASYICPQPPVSRLSSRILFQDAYRPKCLTRPETVAQECFLSGWFFLEMHSEILSRLAIPSICEAQKQDYFCAAGY
jgi:hypothetical protein